MKIALYYPWIYLKSGLERTILETVKRSRNEYVIFTNHFDKRGTFPEFSKLKIIELSKVPVRRDIFSTFKAALTIAFQKLDLSGFDLLLVHSEGLGDLILLRNGKIPVINYCHTPLRPVFDEEYKKRAMEHRPIFLRPVYLLFNFLFTVTDRFLWKKYNAIIFNSRESLRRAKKGGLLGKTKAVKILHPGIDTNKLKPGKIYGNYFMAPGRIMWTKNLEMAIDAFNRFCVSFPNSGFKLFIAGQVDKKSREYFNSLKKIRPDDGEIKFIVNPDDSKMRSIYKKTYAVILTSFNEDWGITALEAAAFAKPVLAINKGGFKESIVNNKTGFLVNNAESMAQKILYLVRNPRRTKTLGQNGRKLIAKYDWSVFVKRHDEILKKVVA